MLVRDAFLARYPVRRYEEYEATLATNTDWNMAIGHDGAQAEFERVSALHGGARHVSGVRAQESGIRRLSMRHHGLSTARACRPIGWWHHEHVFAYLVGYDIPIHPAYACTMGGALDRGRIRVSTIGGERGRAHGRAKWELQYYVRARGQSGGASSSS